MAELTGKQEQAAAEIAKYQAALESAKAELGAKLKDQKVVAVRIRAGQMFIFLRPCLLTLSCITILA